MKIEILNSNYSVIHETSPPESERRRKARSYNNWIPDRSRE
jgi:hypothetical protein